MERRLEYPDEDLSLTEYAVFDDQAEPTVYRIWEHRFSREALTLVLTEAGFEIECVVADFGGTPWEPASEELAVVARRS